MNYDAFFKERGITDGPTQQIIKKLLDSLQTQGRLDLNTVDIKTKCRVDKFEHAHSETPELFESITTDFDGGQTVETFPVEGHV